MFQIETAIMKAKFFLILFIVSIAVGASSCATRIQIKPKPYKVKTIPPGQMKKITGEKSAKRYAPGHNK